jgi:hypothetical protein
MFQLTVVSSCWFPAAGFQTLVSRRWINPGVSYSYGAESAGLGVLLKLTCPAPHRNRLLCSVLYLPCTHSASQTIK